MAVKKDDLTYLDHILECIEALEEYMGPGKEVFLTSRLYQDAVLRRLQIMSESTQQLTQRAKNLESKTAWRQWSDFRNYLTHDYLEVLDFEAIWNLLDAGLEPFKKRIKSIQRKLRGPNFPK